MKFFKNVLLIFIVFLTGNHLIADQAPSELPSSSISSTAADLVKKLINAASNGDTKSVRALVAEGVDVNGVYTFWRETALMAAAERGNIDIVKALIAAGANVNAEHFSGSTALMYAAEGNHINTVRVLMAAEANYNVVNIHGETAIELAARYGHNGVVNAIDDPQEDLNDQLVAVAQYGKATTVKALIAAGANVNATYRNKNYCYGNILYPCAYAGDTALMLAAKHGKIATVKVLIASGADVDAVNSDGTTALIFAAQYGETMTTQCDKIFIIKTLMSAGANYNAVNKYGDTASKYLDMEME